VRNAPLRALLVVLLAGCGGAAAAPEASSATGWRFTDDLGTTVTLDEAPTRVAGLNDVVSSLWTYGVEPVATFGYTALEDDVAFEGKDLGDVEQVGTSYGQIDLERLAAARPDVILLDIQLPGVDGLTLARELKAEPSTRGIALIAFTAYAMKGDEAKMRAAGCDDYIAKPISVAEFAQRVRACVDRVRGEGASQTT